ncbi:MAG: F0F1 ATP synthase subunit A [Verrucomicrobia bacterium]|nr:F0F1 ATP synthase subunit A [Verrucomicrobiota bacterium]
MFGLSSVLPAIVLAVEEQIPLNAEPLTEHGFIRFLTNSIIVAFIVTALLVWAARRATDKMELVPRRTGQNIFEAVVEALYNMLEGIVGRHMVGRAFPLLATFFIFILCSNLFGLVPGVGTIGWGRPSGPLSIDEMHAPLLRPANADLNMTLSMALLFMVFWLTWSLQEMGVGGFLSHMFGPKGGVQGALKYALMPIFFFVGIIEVVSIIFRPVSLSLRLFGNIYAGDNLLHTMTHLGDALPAFLRIPMSILVPVPFYFLELLVAFVQALVFTLLCAVYIQLSTTHDDSHHAAADEAHDDAHQPARAH